MQKGPDQQHSKLSCCKVWKVNRESLLKYKRELREEEENKLLLYDIKLYVK